MTDIMAVLGKDADDLLAHVCKCIPKETLHLPGPVRAEQLIRVARTVALQPHTARTRL